MNASHIPLIVPRVQIISHGGHCAQRNHPVRDNLATARGDARRA